MSIQITAPLPASLTRDGPTFNFLGLPGELRNKIYKMVLKFEPHSRLTKCLPFPHSMQRFLFETDINSLLLLNRQIHCEATSILYQQNAINLYYPDEGAPPYNWFRQEVYPYMSAIHTLKVLCISDRMHPEHTTASANPRQWDGCVRFIKECPRLSSFEIWFCGLASMGPDEGKIIRDGAVYLHDELKELEPSPPGIRNPSTRGFSLRFRKGIKR